MIIGHFGGTPTFHHHFGGEWSRWNLPRVSVYVSHPFPRPCVFVGLALGFQTPNVRRYLDPQKHTFQTPIDLYNLSFGIRLED